MSLQLPNSQSTLSEPKPYNRDATMKMITNQIVFSFSKTELGCASSYWLAKIHRFASPLHLLSLNA